MRQEVYVKFAEAVRRQVTARKRAVFSKIAERVEARLEAVKEAAQPVAAGYNLTPHRDEFRKGMLSGGSLAAGGSLALSGLTGDDKSLANRLARVLGGIGVAYAGNRYATDSAFQDSVNAAGKKVLSTGADWGKRILEAMTGELPRLK